MSIDFIIGARNIHRLPLTPCQKPSNSRVRAATPSCVCPFKWPASPAPVHIARPPLAPLRHLNQLPPRPNQLRSRPTRHLLIRPRHPGKLPNKRLPNLNRNPGQVTTTRKGEERNAAYGPLSFSLPSSSLSPPPSISSSMSWAS